MTEIKEKKTSLPDAIERFILHWGDMGGQWGVNRSVAQIQALLYVSARPLTAEELSKTLSLARSNVSNSLKELLSWRLIRRVPVMGDRRDHFEAETDIWEIVARIAEGRMEREIEPAARVLHHCLAEAQGDKGVTPAARQRLKEMNDFVDMVTRWYAQMNKVPRAKLLRLIKLGSKVVNLLPTGRKGKEESVEETD